jgi:hypothetical protein
MTTKVEDAGHRSDPPPAERHEPAVHLNTVAAMRQASRERRRNTVARMLAALDLMNIDQIASTQGCRHRSAEQRRPKILIEAIRRQLMA